LIAMSDFVVNEWMWLITGAVGAFVLGTAYFRTAGGKRVKDFLQLNVPLMGGMFRKMHLARSLRMVGTMAGAGITLVECVNMWEQVSEKIQHGKQLSEPMFASPLVPRGVSQMLHSAEKSGKLAQVMEQVANFAEQELKDKIAELTRYIEPIMIIAMGIIIGGVAMALLLPIFTMSRVVAS
jgi:type IV pilus assembly protein PilC